MNTINRSIPESGDRQSIGSRRNGATLVRHAPGNGLLGPNTRCLSAHWEIDIGGGGFSASRTRYQTA